MTSRSTSQSSSPTLEDLGDLGTGSIVDGRYLLLEVIGEGAFGTVFLAEHVHIKRRVALKLLQLRHVMDEPTKARFLREAQAAASIDHSAIVAVTDFGEHEGTMPYLAMEYFENDTLADHLDAEGPLDPAVARRFMGLVAEGLAFAHDAGVVHRDLKPENLLLSPDREQVKVTDFGLCAYGAGEKNARDTQSGQVLGTAAYIAPERLWGSEPDGRSDVYALGCILFEALTGRPVFQEDDASLAMRAHLHDPPPRVSDAAPGPIPADLDDLVARCLSKEPADRPTMRSFLAELNETPDPPSVTAPDAPPGPDGLDDNRKTHDLGDAVASLPTASPPQSDSSLPSPQPSPVQAAVAAAEVVPRRQPGSERPGAHRGTPPAPPPPAITAARSASPALPRARASAMQARVSRTAGLSAIARHSRGGDATADRSGLHPPLISPPPAKHSAPASPTSPAPPAQPTGGPAARQAGSRATTRSLTPVFVAAAATSGILLVSIAHLLTQQDDALPVHSPSIPAEAAPAPTPTPTTAPAPALTPPEDAGDAYPRPHPQTQPHRHDQPQRAAPAQPDPLPRQAPPPPPRTPPQHRVASPSKPAPTPATSSPDPALQARGPAKAPDPPPVAARATPASSRRAPSLRGTKPLRSAARERTRPASKPKATAPRSRRAGWRQVEGQLAPALHNRGRGGRSGGGRAQGDSDARAGRRPKVPGGSGAQPTPKRARVKSKAVPSESRKEALDLKPF